MWNKLSIKDKAKHIKELTKNRVASLADIKRVYNKYAGGGPVNTSDDPPQQEEEFYFAPWLNENMWGVVPYKDYFFKDWFTERKKAFGESYPHNTEDDGKMYNLLNTVNEYFSPYYSQSDDPDVQLVRKHVNYPIDNEMANQMRELDMDEHRALALKLADINVLGAYNPLSHTIGYNWPTTSVVMHERTHSLQPRKFEKPIIERISNDTKQQFLQPGKKYDTYLDDAKEIYARLMQLRHDLGLNPAKRDYKAEDIRKEYRGSESDYNIFERYSDDFIEFLLNDVVQNNTDNKPYNWSTDILSNNNYLT